MSKPAWLAAMLASPFVQDTVMPVYGNRFDVMALPSAEREAKAGYNDQRRIATVSPIDPHLIVFKNRVQGVPSDEILSHELMHVATLTKAPEDVYKLALDISVLTPEEWRKQPSGMEEYVAWTMSKAFHLLRQGTPPTMEEANASPGLAQAYQFIKDHVDNRRKHATEEG